MRFMEVKRLAGAEGLPLPAYAHDTDAGLDLRAAIPEGYTLRIPPGARRTIPTGFAVGIPAGHYGRIAPRSGLAVRRGIDVMAGVVDEGYRGEVIALLVNLGTECFEVKRGDRIAQLIVTPVTHVGVLELGDDVELSRTERDLGGFGSSGVE